MSNTIERATCATTSNCRALKPNVLRPTDASPPRNKRETSGRDAPKDGTNPNFGTGGSLLTDPRRLQVGVLVGF